MTTSPLGAGRTILSVLGPHSGCGKSSFVLQLIRHVSGVGCLKVSPAYDASDPAATGDESIEQEFYFENPDRLRQPGKDTALYLHAGAVQVERLRCRPGGIAAGLQAALARFPMTLPIVVESSSGVHLLQPVAVVLVVRPPIKEMKVATQRVLPLVTDLVVNLSNPGALGLRDAKELQRQFPALRPQFVWPVDLASAELQGEMLERMRSLLKC